MPDHGDDEVPEQTLPRDEHRRRVRRVRTDAPPGSDPHPAGEPARHRAGENDERLRRDAPPHYGSGR